MPKVLIHSNYAPTNFGGVEHVVSQLISIAKNNGFEVVCFYGGNSNKLIRVSAIVSYVERKILYKAKGACFLSLGNLLFFLQALKSRIVIYQEPYPSLWPALFFLQWFTRIETVVLVHADPDAHSVVKWLYNKLRRILLSKSHVVTTSPQLLSSLDLIKFKSSNIIPLGIPYQDIRQHACIVEKSYVLYFGRLADYKGIDYLLDSIKVLPHIPFVIAGQGPLSTMVGEFIASNNLANVRFINERISEEQKITLIRSCSLLVFPSTTKNEAFGIVQLEAMREGKPIVNTMLDNGVNFVAPDGLCAISCPPKDSVSLSLAIDSIWTDDYLRSKLSAAARKRFEEKFTSDYFADLWSKLLGKIVRSS